MTRLRCSHSSSITAIIMLYVIHLWCMIAVTFTHLSANVIFIQLYKSRIKEVKQETGDIFDTQGSALSKP